VNECGSDEGVAEVLVSVAGAVSRGQPVLQALLASEVAPSTAVGHVAQFLDVHVDQGAGVVVLVAADRFCGDSVDVGEPVDPTPDQDLVDRRRGDADLVGNLHRSQPLLPAQVHDLADHRLRGPVRGAMRP
jgi:hypothetical protein